MYDYTVILTGIIGGIVFALSGLFKALKEGESPDPVKFGTTAVLGGIVGGIMGLSGIPFNEENFGQQIVLFGFLTVILENIFKALFRKEEPVEGAIAVGEANGWKIQINTSKYVLHLPVEKRYQAVSPRGRVWSGDKEMIEYLVKSDDQAAKAWRDRFG